jgi:hypothetical protein
MQFIHAKRLIYSRWDGKPWTTTYLVKVGPRLNADDADDEDDTGLSAIFMGVTCDHGATWN